MFVTYIQIRFRFVHFAKHPLNVQPLEVTDDAAVAGNVETRTSTSAMIVIWHRHAIFWLPCRNAVVF
jgi:hypothetical protein